jgi:acyl-ACP thioesterase
MIATIAQLPATQLMPLPAVGRRFMGARPVRLGDVDPTGRLRLDAVARYLQDVASDDAADAGLDTGWVARRTLIEVTRPAVLGERIELTTFCSGTGRSWAERRTSISGAAGASIDAVSLWVQIDPTNGRPTALGDVFHTNYGEAAAGRRVSSRLVLPPPDGSPVRPWAVRAVDLDPYEHVNNASQWAILEEVLPPGRGLGTAELEHVLPIDADTPVVLHVAATDGATSAWLVAGGRVHTAARWRVP